MQIFTRVEDFTQDPEKILLLGLGNFDGVHLGHRRLLGRALEDAKRRGGKAGVFTFQEHPQAVLHPQNRPQLLTSPEQRLMLFREIGLAVCFFIPFTAEFSRIEPEDFVRDILKKKLGVEKVFLGASARFGHGRRGDSKLMARLADECGFEFEEIPPVEAGGGIVSSSRIRKLVQEGNLEEAGACLGRPFGLLGKVIEGAGRGKSLGYPTANLEINAFQALPPQGVYPVRVRVDGPWLSGVLNYGLRPTFKDGPAVPVLEVFILDFSGSLYGKTLEVLFYPRLRAEKAFQDAEALKTQIAQDVETARNYFQSNPLQEGRF